LTFKFPPGGGRAGDNVKQPFEILYKDNHKAAIVSPADVRSKVNGPSPVVVQTRGAANKYATYFTTDTPGEYTVTAMVRNFSQNHTFSVSGATDPTKCYVQGNNRVKAGSSYTCKVIVVDVLGNPLTTSLDDKLEVSVIGPENSFGKFVSTAHDDGKFTVSVEVLRPKSEYELQLKLNGCEIGASPWKFSTE